MKNLLSIFLFFMVAAISNAQTGHVLSLNDSSSISLKRINFECSGKAIELYDNQWPIAIDGLPLFGTDGELPMYQLNKLMLRIGSKIFDLQTDGMYNPWFGDKPFRENFALKIDGTEIRLQGIFSDAAGSYGAEWLIVGQSSIRTILTRDKQIIYEYFRIYK